MKEKTWDNMSEDDGKVIQAVNVFKSLKPAETKIITDYMKELADMCNDYIELCEKIHNKSEEIPKKIMEDLWDNVYKHYEP